MLPPLKQGQGAGALLAGPFGKPLIIAPAVGERYRRLVLADAKVDPGPLGHWPPTARPVITRHAAAPLLIAACRGLQPGSSSKSDRGYGLCPTRLLLALALGVRVACHRCPATWRASRGATVEAEPIPVCRPTAPASWTHSRRCRDGLCPTRLLLALALGVRVACHRCPAAGRASQIGRAHV